MPKTDENNLFYEDSGGAVRLGKALYVEREVDTDFGAALERRRDIFVVTAPRQSGKSSLWIKARDRVENQGFSCGGIDLREVFGVPEDSTTNVSGWTQTLLRAFARAFDQESKEVNRWLAENKELPAVNLITSFFSEFLRGQLEGPIIAAIDEIDVVQLYYYFTDNLFEAIRALASRRDELDISFVLIGINPPEMLMEATGVFNFNIARNPISLPDFDSNDQDTVDAWASIYPTADKVKKRAISKAILEETGGQPYLTSCYFSEAMKRGINEMDELIALLNDLRALAKDETWKPAHFRSPQQIILARPSLATKVLDIYEDALRGPVEVVGKKLEVRAALMSSGLVSLDRKRDSYVAARSPIYREVFDKAWVAELRKNLGNEVFAENQTNFVAARESKRKRICIINTGGMISTELRPDGKIVVPPDLTRFFRKFSELNVIAEVHAVPLMSKDSSDVNPDDWIKISEAIYSRRFDDFDGFVVVHGTDTLPHTASAVAFALGDALKFPVVFVGSQVGSHVIHGDARINLIRAAAVAAKDDPVIPEVVAVVGDQIHRGVRVEKKDDFRFDGLHSPTWRPLGVISDDIDIAPNDMRRFDRRREMLLQNKFSHGVLKFGLYPGLAPEFLFPLLDNQGLDGVIIETLGIGNVPTEGHWSLLPFIRESTQRNIPVLLASQFPIQTRMTKSYGPAEPPLAAGAIPALNMSPPAAVTKFMWVLPQVERKISEGMSVERRIHEVKEMMRTDYVGELEEPDEE